MNKTTFNNLSLSNQVKYFNSRLLEGENIQQICKSINISYSTIRDRFKRNNYTYNKLFKRYENQNYLNKTSIPDTLINYLITQLNNTEIKLECKKRNSKLISRSFRLHSCVLNDFIIFCNHSKFTQQDMLSQFIADGLNKYK